MNVKIYGEVSPDVFVPVAVNSDGGLILDPGSVGSGGGGTGGGLTDVQLRAVAVPVSLDAATLAALESIDATINDGGGSITVDGAVGVSGTVAISNFPAAPETGVTDAELRAAPVPVSGPLTDTQLRAAAVPISLDAAALAALEHVSIDNFPATQPVSGTVAVSNLPATQAVSGPLTDTELRATAVPVSGTVTATGPLTDTQLRASAVPVAVPDATASGTLATTGDAVTVAVAGRSTVGFSVVGTFTGLTVVVERSNDGGATWLRASFLNGASGSTFLWVSAATASTAITTGRQLLAEAAGATHIRLRAVALASGSVAVSATLTNAAISPMLGLLNTRGNVPAEIVTSIGGLISGTPLDSQTNFNSGLFVQNMGASFNESTWDRQRGNTDVSLLTSAARTATNSSADKISYNARRLLLLVDVSLAGTGSITPSLQVKELNSSNYKTIWTATAALVANGTAAYYFADGALGTSATFTEVLPFGLPSRVWRLTVMHNNANTISYSASAVSSV